MSEGNPMQVRCGAHCRTTGKPCLNFCMPNGRCRMHGGKSAGRPLKSGLYTHDAIAERRRLRELILNLQRLVANLEKDSPR